jgi:hypothetical protein
MRNTRQILSEITGAKGMISQLAREIHDWYIELPEEVFTNLDASIESVLDHFYDRPGLKEAFEELSQYHMATGTLAKRVLASGKLGEAKVAAPPLTPGEIHVPREWERKPRVARLGGRVKAPWAKRATVIHDPAVDRVIRKIEQFLGDVEGGDPAENCWTLAIDAAHECGYDGDMGIRIAKAACAQLGYPRK